MSRSITTKEHIKDLIKEIVHEMPHHHQNEEISSSLPIVPRQPEQEADKPIDYAVKVSLDESRDGIQLKAEAFIWDDVIDKAEANHIKLELDRLVAKFIKDKNRNARKIR